MELEQKNETICPKCKTKAIVRKCSKCGESTEDAYCDCHAAIHPYLVILKDKENKLICEDCKLEEELSL